MPRANGETAVSEPAKQLAHAAFVQIDAKFGCNAVTQISTPEPHDVLLERLRDWVHRYNQARAWMDLPTGRVAAGPQA